MTIMVVRMMIFMCDNIGCLKEWVVSGGGVDGVVGVLNSFCVMLCVILCMMLCLIVCMVVKFLLRWNNDFMLFWGFDLSLTDGRTDGRTNGRTNERTFVLLESLSL